MCGMFCTIQDIISSLYDIKPPFLWNHTHYIWHRIYCICVITPTALVISHQLNFWDLIRYMMTSYPLYMTSQPLNACHHTHFFNGITSFVCRTSHPLYVSYHIHCIKHYLHILWHHTTLFMRSHALYSWYHPHYLWNQIHHICFITTTLLMVSDQLYVWHHTHFTYASLCTLHNLTSTLYDFKPL